MSQDVGAKHSMTPQNISNFSHSMKSPISFSSFPVKVWRNWIYNFLLDFMHKDQQYNIYLKLGCYKTVEGGGASITIKKGVAKKVLAMLNVGAGTYKKFHSLKWGARKSVTVFGGGGGGGGGTKRITLSEGGRAN